MAPDSLQELCTQYQGIHENWSQEVTSAQAALNARILEIEDLGGALVAQMVQNGSKVVFSSQGSYVDNPKSKERLAL